MSLEPSYTSKCAGMHVPAKTLPAYAAAGYVPPVPLPQPAQGPISHYPCPKPAYTQSASAPCPPAYTWPVAGIKGKSSAGTILVLFILLVIISRSFPAYGEAKICRK